MKKLKKLSLDKKSIVHLDKSVMKNIQGGVRMSEPPGCNYGPGSGGGGGTSGGSGNFPIWTVAPYATCGGCNPTA
ncbi:hypothetical protein SF1_42010 [Sphingobacterium faecium NBRC 15299]|uniref:class I lanthipeptide n=1 Tax=Sphingobacterium faecium TaxID=34087 RepID=UPI000D36B7E6|nr:class I lanthipeptide [Sphingobacterium faecium]PTX06974.1 natural product precursor [Sphingobacterium faecium]GEM66219.1 hypothetical protein SF1_42010 [Sphingobacterium faecium NBRC 15299]